MKNKFIQFNYNCRMLKDRYIVLENTAMSKQLWNTSLNQSSSCETLTTNKMFEAPAYFVFQKNLRKTH